MAQARRGGALGSTALAALGVALRFALLLLPLAVLRAASHRPRSLADLTDRELLDIGLARSDVERPGERPGLAELEARRLMRGPRGS